MIGSNFGFLRRSVKRAVAAKRNGASRLAFSRFRVFALRAYALSRFRLPSQLKGRPACFATNQGAERLRSGAGGGGEARMRPGCARTRAILA